MSMESVNIVDIIILTLFAFSVLIGVYRGLMREAITLFVWTLAIVLAITHGAKLGSLFVFLPSLSMQKYVGGITIFVLVVFLGLVAKIMAFKSFGIGKPTGIDRFLGGFFGIFRAWVVIVLALVLLESTSVKDQPQFIQSRVIPYFYWAVDLVDGRVTDKWKNQKENTAVPDTVPMTTQPITTPTKEEIITPNNLPIPDVTQSGSKK